MSTEMKEGNNMKTEWLKGKAKQEYEKFTDRIRGLYRRGVAAEADLLAACHEFEQRTDLWAGSGYPFSKILSMIGVRDGVSYARYRDACALLGGRKPVEAVGVTAARSIARLVEQKKLPAESVQAVYRDVLQQVEAYRDQKGVPPLPQRQAQMVQRAAERAGVKFTSQRSPKDAFERAVAALRQIALEAQSIEVARFIAERCLQDIGMRETQKAAA
jgi:hypothetical protein